MLEFNRAFEIVTWSFSGKEKYTFGNFLYLLQVFLDVFSPFF